MTALLDRPTVPGVTYRQLDHWARRGYLHPEQARPGTGYDRTWPEHELEVARTMGRLVAAGISPAVAAGVARGESQIGAGVWVLVDVVGGS